MGSLIAAVATGVATTTLTYPLDIVHGRMAADMSKKPPVIVDKSQLTQKSKLYTGVGDCFVRIQESGGLSSQKQIKNLYRGY